MAKFIWAATQFPTSGRLIRRTWALNREVSIEIFLLIGLRPISVIVASPIGLNSMFVFDNKIQSLSI
jgi:hypothetical protein